MIDVGRSGASLAPALSFLVAQAGHVGCHGWMVDRRAGLLRCVCGTALYEFHAMDRPCAASSATGRPGAEGGPG